MKHRLYIDEVGNSNLASSEENTHRYLSLTGVAFKLTDIDELIFPRLEDLKKRYFGSHPDDPIILHRKEIINKKEPFSSLQNPEIEEEFNNDLLNMLRSFSYIVFSVVLDKKDLKDRYSVYTYDPYHYCLTILIERYVLWLSRNEIKGDVLAESRGGKEDLRLKGAFSHVYNHGTNYIVPDLIQECLTSRELKVKTKSNNIAGLQIADLIAYPSYKYILIKKGLCPPINVFGSKIAEILEESKYDRDQNNNIEGFGIKWLP